MSKKKRPAHDDLKQKKLTPPEPTASEPRSPHSRNQARTRQERCSHPPSHCHHHHHHRLRQVNPGEGGLPSPCLRRRLPGGKSFRRRRPPRRRTGRTVRRSWPLRHPLPFSSLLLPLAPACQIHHKQIITFCMGYKRRAVLLHRVCMKIAVGLNGTTNTTYLCQVYHPLREHSCCTLYSSTQQQQ